MSRALQSICIFCETKTISSLTPLRRPTSIVLSPSASSIHPQWSNQTRNVSRLAVKRKPARLDLSPDVAKSHPRKKGGAKDRRGFREGFANNGPWAGMNRTRVNPASLPTANLRAMSQAGDKASAGKSNNKSREPFHALKMQRALSHVPYAKRTAIKQAMSEVESFAQFGLVERVQEAIVPNGLGGMLDAKPTPIQKLAIPALLGERKKRTRSKEVRKQFLLAAETGSGKTLAYMIPTIDALKRQEVEEEEAGEAEKTANKEEEKKTLDLYDLEELEAQEAKLAAGRPRIIILVPTSELVDQVNKTAKAFAHHVKFRARAISTAYSADVIRNSVFNPAGIDMLISTPQLLTSIAQATPGVLSKVTHLIVDEADSLLDKSFEEHTTEIISRTTPSLKQLIMCSATIPRKMDNYLRDHYPDIVRLTTPNLHAIPRRVQLAVVDCDKGSFFCNKNLACADAIWNIGKKASVHDSEDSSYAEGDGIKRVVVFVNERSTVGELATYLQSKGIDATAFTRDTDARAEKDILAEFTQADLPQGSSSAVGGMSKAWQTSGIARKLDNVRVLVTTDIASRGIDTTPVRDVILYDVPNSTIDFIHRLGRTGRMGRRGRGIVLVGKHDRRDVVSEVKHGMFRGQALI
ncbi:ATP-dependent RNA helicase Mrh4, mitochondrial [Microthyrium microscopicum]|uniref:RNA helicase n=1 Tax=Microthyrium microscopicum TaxID=703497 RepID=A0A6A6UVN0_9PEZI|nr:ATP-dependent RNA helicase Mrh4, mitochondrial [Microthyrium microscopicum]